MNCKHNVVQVIDGVKSCELCGEIISVPKLSKAKWNQAVKNCLKAIDKGKKAREEYCLICNKAHNSKPINKKKFIKIAKRVMEEPMTPKKPSKERVKKYDAQMRGSVIIGIKWAFDNHNRLIFPDKKDKNAKQSYTLGELADMCLEDNRLNKI